MTSVADDTPRREAFSITPKGYYFRSQFFRKLDHLINEFKRQPVPDRVSTAADLDFQPAPEAVRNSVSLNICDCRRTN